MSDLDEQHVTLAEHRLRLALRAGCIAAWEWDLATDRVIWSENSEDLLGLRSGRPTEFYERVHPDDRNHLQTALQATIEQDVPYEIELRFRSPGGEYIWVLDRAQLDTGISGQRVLIGTTAEITLRKQAEAVAREKSALLEATLNNMDQGLLLVDAEKRIALFNRRTCELLDLPSDLLASRPAFEEVREFQSTQGEFAYAPDPVMEQVFRGGVTARPLQHERTRPNGTTLEVRTVPLPEGGAVRTFTDITARKRVEDALRQSEERARDFANIASDWFWETDAEFRYTSIMGLAQVFLADQAVGKTPWDAVEADPTSRDWRRLSTAFTARKPFRDFEFEVSTPRGRRVWLSSSGMPLFNQNGEFVGYRGVSSNITHRKQAEVERQNLLEELHKAQRLESVGQLTGGIAHDFNNLLTVILGNAEILVETPTDPAVISSLSRQILDAAEKGADLTQKLLAFGRRQSLKPERLNLEAIVEEMMPLLRRTIGEHIAVKTEHQPTGFVALTDRTLLESAILNLVVNARDAMATGGVLTISTGRRFAGRSNGALPIGQDVVFVTVSDTGTGMSPEVLERVFEPFFTTKEVGKGSGLGLPMVYGFAKQGGGHVTVVSQEGAGTSVTILLPAITAAGGETPALEADESHAAGAGRVLLVEDEATVLNLVAAQLVNLGYTVEAVTNGPDALDVMRRDRGFDLLFTDVMLPKGMSGVELARLARAMQPNLKVLLTSGYPEEVFQHHGRPDQGTILLRKPYRRKDLADALRQALESP